MKPDRSRTSAQLNALLIFGFALVVIASQASAAERIYTAYFSPAPGGSSVIWVAKEARLFDKYGLDVAPVELHGAPWRPDAPSPDRSARR